MAFELCGEFEHSDRIELRSVLPAVMLAVAVPPVPTTHALTGSGGRLGSDARENWTKASAPPSPTLPVFQVASHGVYAFLP